MSDPQYDKQPLPVPTDEMKTLVEAKGSFVQWPIDLVLLEGQVLYLFNPQIKVSNCLYIFE